MKEKIIDIILWITLPIWFIPVMIYYIHEWDAHQEDYLKEKKDVR